MRKFVAAAIAAGGLALAGCQTVGLPSLNLSTAVSLNTIYGIENAYGVAIAAANAYKALPLCKTGTVPSAANVCAKRSTVIGLQAGMRKARVAVDSLVTLHKTYPSVDLTNALAAARAALSGIQQTLATGVQ
ncbi:MAG TPA: hypothetical protein VHC94_17830 [Nitrobacter sp.]|nr:hypothetical protein [Nitrobacter sp.]